MPWQPEGKSSPESPAHASRKISFEGKKSKSRTHPNLRRRIKRMDAVHSETYALFCILKFHSERNALIACNLSFQLFT